MDIIICIELYSRSKMEAFAEPEGSRKNVSIQSFITSQNCVLLNGHVACEPSVRPKGCSIRETILAKLDRITTLLPMY